MQIKTQKIKDKDICENSELTAELNCPKEAESEFLTGRKKSRKDRAELSSITEVKRKAIISINMEKYSLFLKMLSLKTFVKNLRVKTTLLQEADPRMLHRGRIDPGTAIPRCWMLRLKNKQCQSNSHTGAG